MEYDAQFYAQFSIDYVGNEINNKKSSNDKPVDLNSSVLFEEAIFIGYFRSVNYEYSPIYLIGRRNGESVYRLSKEAAIHAGGSRTNSVVIHDPPLFPDIVLEQCGLNQVDVTLCKN
ncbi:unnamed protein product, partial [Adineta ricciae]